MKQGTAALYARFSTDNQNELSAQDQLELCRRHAEKLGYEIVASFRDEGISGTSMANRPGVQDLLAFVREGRCDVVIAEHTNRLARDGEDGWGIFHTLRACRVSYLTCEEGTVTRLKQGVSSLLSELKIEESQNKTRRGMRAAVGRGLNVTAPPYGYRRKRVYDEAGEPVRGHLEVDEAQADVVRRIFREYVAGASALAIAAALNGEGVAAPHGGLWCVATIKGSRKLRKGILLNDLYDGVRVWGRRSFMKNRDTGGRIAMDADPDELVRQDVPELRIVPEDLWRQAQDMLEVTARPGAPGGRRRGKHGERFLSGLILCGLCGSRMGVAGPKDLLRCSNRTLRAGCSNARTPSYAVIEAQVSEQLRAELLHPDVIAHAVRTIQQETQKVRKDLARRQATLSAELGEVRRKAARLIDQVADGVLEGKAVAAKIRELEARADQLERAMTAKPSADVVAMHPNAAGKYRAYVQNLRDALEQPDGLEDREAREAVRALVRSVRILPLPQRGKFEVELEANAEGLLDPLASPFTFTSKRRLIM